MTENHFGEEVYSTLLGGMSRSDTRKIGAWLPCSEIFSVDCEGRNVTVSVPNRVFSDYVSAHFNEAIALAGKTVLGGDCEVEFKVDPNSRKYYDPPNLEDKPTDVSQEPVKRQILQVTAADLAKMGIPQIHGKYIRHGGNTQAANISLEVCRRLIHPGQRGNLVFIGLPGSGKTALATRAAKYVAENGKPVYCSNVPEIIYQMQINKGKVSPSDVASAAEFIVIDGLERLINAKGGQVIGT